jgi:hypothetical protein
VILRERRASQDAGEIGFLVKIAQTLLEEVLMTLGEGAREVIEIAKNCLEALSSSCNPCF